MTDTRDDPGVVVHFKHVSPDFIARHQHFLLFIRIHDHGTEFVYTECTPVFPHPCLGKKDGARGLDENHGSNHKADHKGHHTPHRAAQDIQKPFAEQEPHGYLPVKTGNHVHVADPLQCFPGDILQKLLHVDMDHHADGQKLLCQLSLLPGVVRNA